MEKIGKNVNSRFRKKGIKSLSAQIIINVYVWVTVLLVIFPLVMTLLFSVKGINDFDKSFWAFPEKIMWSNYSYGFSKVTKNMLNSVLVGIIVTFATLAVASFISYVFVRKEFYGRTVLLTVLIALMMIPSVISLTPRYLLVQELGMKNTWWALILPWTAGNLVGAVFLFTTFMRQQPKELYESATLDGAGDFSTYFYLCLPLSIPVLMIKLVGVFSGCYNEYLWSLLVIDTPGKQMLMPELKALTFEATQETGNQGITYAMYLISGIPLIFSSAIGLKFFINGDFASGLKL